MLLIYVVLWFFWSSVAMLFVPLIWLMLCAPLILFVPEEVCSDSTRFGLGGLAFCMMLASTPVLGLILSRISL